LVAAETFRAEDGVSVSAKHIAEINAKTQRREGAKQMKLDQSGLLNSDRSRPARETCSPCVFASLRLCVEI
jgi:hypothetical protein